MLDRKHKLHWKWGHIVSYVAHQYSRVDFYSSLEVNLSLYYGGVVLYCCGSQPGGGTDLERGYGDVRPWRPPFHASPAARKGPISSKRVSSQDPFLRKFWNLSLNSLNFHPNCSSQAPKFGNFQLTSPQIWKFSAHKPPFSEANVSSQAPLFGNPGRTPLPEKKLSAPPPRGSQSWSADLDPTSCTHLGVKYQRYCFYSHIKNADESCFTALGTFYEFRLLAWRLTSCFWNWK